MSTLAALREVESTPFALPARSPAPLPGRRPWRWWTACAAYITGGGRKPSSLPLAIPDPSTAERGAEGVRACIAGRQVLRLHVGDVMRCRDAEEVREVWNQSL